MKKFIIILILVLFVLSTIGSAVMMASADEGVTLASEVLKKNQMITMV